MCVMKNAQYAIRRRGLSLSGLLVILMSITSIGTIAWFASPIVLHAGSTAKDEGKIAEKDWPDELKGLVDALDILLRKSTSTELIRRGNYGDGSVEFIVLWVSDQDDIGHVNESEVAVLRFSQFLGSVSVFAQEARAEDFSKKHEDRRIDGMLRDGSFIDAFLQRADTRGRVIGVHINSFRLDRSYLSDKESKTGIDSSVGRIELTYRGDSADSPIVAFVPTALPPMHR